MENLKRNCPCCNEELFYQNKRSFNNSLKINRLCQTCSRYGPIEKRKIYNLERVCHSCKNIIKYKNAICCYKAKKKNSLCKTCSASLQLKNNKNKQNNMKLGLLEKRKTYNWSIKTAKIRKENGSYFVTEEVREKHRINKIERMIKQGILIWPSFSKEACKVFDKIEKDFGWDGFYATKGKEKRIGRFWVDYYEPHKNIVIEYDEPYHFDKDGNLKEKDVKRQKLIEQKIGCRFYRISESTNYERFKHFLLNNLPQ